jgi:adenine-specific DNA-methyltransferase
MSVVFIGGSRRLSRLNALIRGRLDNIIERNHAVLIGDANGGDRAVQGYLAERGYRSVTVYCTNGDCRNNVGQWPVRSVAATDQRGFDYYALKDAAMAGDAECGFMLWDGKSKGTLFNIRRLLAAGKPVVVYLAANHACHTIRCEDELAGLVMPLQGDTQQRHDGGNPAGQGALFPTFARRANK